MARGAEFTIAHKIRSILEILPTTIFIWLDYDNLSLNTIPRLVVDLIKSILFPLIHNSGMTRKYYTEDLMHSLLIEAQFDNIH